MMILFSTVVNKGMFITSLHYFSAGDELLSNDSYLIVDVFSFLLLPWVSIVI